MFVRRLLVFGFAVVTMTGCTANIQSVYYPDTPTFEQRPRDSRLDTYLVADAPAGLQIALSESRLLSDVPVGAIVLGRVDVQGRSNWLTSITAATSKANRWGGDALVIDRATLNRHDAGAWMVLYEFSAEVIRYSDERESGDG